MIESSVNAFYQFLNHLGFTDPVHAALVHMPIGLAVGALCFSCTASLFRREKLAVTARHCAILSLIFWFPAVVFGLTDWQHFYNGAWLTPIKIKMVLAVVLLILLSAAIYFGGSVKPVSKKIVLALCTLSVVTATLLGWFGARLVYDGRVKETPAAQGVKEAPVSYEAGERIFIANCRSCHPDGGNVIDPGEPIRGSRVLKSPEAFIAVIRKPKKPMPAYSPSQLSDEDARQLYLYVTNVLVKSNKAGSK